MEHIELTKEELTIIIAAVVQETIQQLGICGIAQSANLKPNYPNKVETKDKSAYAKTEALLYNYNGFKRILLEKEAEIENIKKFGVPKRSASIVEYSVHGGIPQGIVLDEESVDAAIQNVLDSVQGTVQAIRLIDKHMAALKNDPYYCILEMRYMQGRTQEDIATELNCSQVTISKNKSRLIKELAMRLFPDQSMKEMMN